jgi:hypothetical protein
MKPYPMREEHEPVSFPGAFFLIDAGCALGGALAVTCSPGVTAGRILGGLLGWLILCGLLAAILALITWVRNRRRAAGHAYRQATDPIVDESLGTWVHHSMRDRDNRRGHGHWEGK